MVPSPRRGAEADVNEIAWSLESSSRNGQAQLKASCFRRDNYRCVLTRAYDLKEACERFSEAEMGEMLIARTECAHIIPFSFGSFTEARVTHSLLSL